MKILECLSLMFWPILSVVLGMVVGTIIALFTTALVFVITLVRTPIHIAKMMYVTATTEVCFKERQYFDPVLRVLVFFLVPVPHLLWLVGVTIYCLFCGILFHISKTTKTIYANEYGKAIDKASSNLRFDKESHLGSYVEECKEFMARDDKSHCAIDCLKGILSLFPGTLLGALPFIPFSIAVLGITLYRLPVNLFVTMKVAYKTVTLKCDLKICALIFLPVIHIVFPLVVLCSALVGSFAYFVSRTTQSIYESKSPFEKWDKFRLGLKEYHDAHQRFVGEDYIGRYDHPTGIPSGWEGESYGLPIRKILKWQWQFLVCCLLLLVGLVICFLASFLIFAVKVVPGTFSWWRLQYKHISEMTTVECLSLWAFHLLGLVLTPAGAVLAAVMAVLGGTLSAFEIPFEYLNRGGLSGLYAPLAIIYEIDSWDFYNLGEFRVFRCLVGAEHRRAPGSDRYRDTDAQSEERMKLTDSYWDRFASQCIRTTSILLREKWITLDQVLAMEPSIIQSIPAVAILTILVDSIHDNKATHKEDISWKIDGTLCNAEHRGSLDNVAVFLWPKLMKIKRLMDAGNKTTNNKPMVKEANVKIITAMLCSTTDDATPELREFLEENDKECSENNNNKQVRSMLVELSLMLLRVKPFQMRMTSIFEFDYAAGELISEDGMVEAKLGNISYSSIHK